MDRLEYESFFPPQLLDNQTLSTFKCVCPLNDMIKFKFPLGVSKRPYRDEQLGCDLSVLLRFSGILKKHITNQTDNCNQTISIVVLFVIGL